MKNVKIKFYVQFLSMSFASLMQADLNHVCAHSNESIVKFRKKTVGETAHHARSYCQDRKILHHGVHFSWPVDMCKFWISSLYGPRVHKGVKKHHGGVDMAATKGSDVMASAPGKVIRIQFGENGYGNAVEILHKGSFVTRYAHLHEIFVHEGERVDRGDVIATVGASGNVRGKSDPSHLHFEIIGKDGQRIDPLPLLYCTEVASKHHER